MYNPQEIKTIESCEVCNGKILNKFLDLKEQPMCDDLQPLSSSIKAKKYPLEIKYCPICLTAHQVFQINRELLFPKQYHYRAALTKDVLLGMEDFVDGIEGEYQDLKNKLILDVGCNDGSLLEIFQKRGALPTGIEPTDACKGTKLESTILNQYFDDDSTEEYLQINGKPDFITFTNVFAHIDDLESVIKNLKKLSHEKTVVVIENHYLGAVLSLDQFDTFYHEHPRTYSFKSFQYIAQKLDMHIAKCEFPERYNGNIRVYMQTTPPESVVSVPEEEFERLMQGFQSQIDYLSEQVLASLRENIQKNGPLYAKAFPGRASVIINYLGLTSNDIVASFERSSSPKIGHFIPGTDIPILDEKEMFIIQPNIILNFAWHIHQEISEYLKIHCPDSKILKIWPRVE